MIFYFSGTGNSRWAALETAKLTGDRAVFIPRAEANCRLRDNEPVGFVFPIYAWAPPACVTAFIKSVQLDNYQNNFCYFIATCHSQTGNIDGIMKKALASRGWRCDAGFSVRMPNNYLLAPLVKTDTPQKRNELLRDAQMRLKDIAADISRRTSKFDLRRGSKLLSLITPLFQKHMTAKDFRVERDKCVKCGKCAEICPVNNIRLTPFPQWGSRCEMCQACLSVCPTAAIQYGRYTKGKQRYMFSEEYLNED